MYRGRARLGEHLTLSVRTRDGSESPAAPDACPRLDVYDAAGRKVVSRPVPVLDAGAVTGLFGYRLYLGADFAAGQYSAVFHWSVGGSFGGEVQPFQVVAGGNAQGAVIALKEFVKPHARFVVHQLDSGRLKRGRNPRL